MAAIQECDRVAIEHGDNSAINKLRVAVHPTQQCNAKKYVVNFQSVAASRTGLVGSEVYKTITTKIWRCMVIASELTPIHTIWVSSHIKAAATVEHG
jgi:hypothetical protein